MRRTKADPSSTSTPNRRRSSANDSQNRPSDSDLLNRYAFRRNRTLTGSSSSKITSSNELNAELKSPRAHVHHLTSLRRRLLLYFACVGLVAFSLYLLVSQLVATSNVTVSGIGGALPQTDAAEYVKVFDSYYSARPVERLRFLLDESAFLSHVQAARPEVRSIQVESGAALGEATMVIVAREPIARWSIAGSTQYVDGDGGVFSRNYFGDPSLEIVDNSGIPTDANRLVASDRFLGFVGRVIAKSEAQGLSVAKVTIPAFTTRQVAVMIQGQSTEYKLSVDRSAGEQVEDMARITRYLSAQNLQPEYVDVRISGKAFYK